MGGLDTVDPEPGTLFSVTGLVAVVTGGGTGIGRWMARALALHGAEKVYILGRRLESLEECASSVDTGNIIPIQCNITTKDDLERAAAQVADQAGFINLLCCNAGVPGPRSAVRPATSTIDEFVAAQWAVSAEDYAGTFLVNDTATWFTCIAFLRLLDAGNKKGSVSQSSQIIATASVAAFNRATPGNFAYAQSKVAVVHMMKQLATGLAPHKIRANVICPGVFPTDLSTWSVSAGMLTSGNFPAGRFGEERDIAGVILFLASAAGAHVNGNVMVVDGGSIGTLPSTY
ncbi:Glucose/ribitol dehydrogenase [Pleurostoma richardsiae]|uniref:Glucose/ribitol dehydrogenase n=1 Tax=Pleurostoma richardsiae TaxID=41990 RepID=A0AA38RAZ4_9PEZI|nr:Glucose/ribitol dehydrogenase [Pleurostoma richardsiae]